MIVFARILLLLAFGPSHSARFLNSGLRRIDRRNRPSVTALKQLVKVPFTSID